MAICKNNAQKKQHIIERDNEIERKIQQELISH